MDAYEILKSAINAKQVIRFNYASSEGAVGERVGSPHALYTHPTTRKINCDINQHFGDSATGNAVPFKPFTVTKMSGIELVDGAEFQMWGKYETDAPRYVNAIEKI